MFYFCFHYGHLISWSSNHMTIRDTKITDENASISVVNWPWFFSVDCLRWYNSIKLLLFLRKHYFNHHNEGCNFISTLRPYGYIFPQSLAIFIFYCLSENSSCDERKSQLVWQVRSLTICLPEYLIYFIFIWKIIFKFVRSYFIGKMHLFCELKFLFYKFS